VEETEGNPSLESPKRDRSEGGRESSREASAWTRIGTKPHPIIVPTPVVVRREFLGGEDTDSDEPL